MSEQEQKLEQPADEAESREDELTRKVARFVEGPIVGILVLIVYYYGGRQGGNSQFVNHALWQDILRGPSWRLASCC